MVGEVTLERPYFYCVGCERGVHPLDEALELAGRRKQWDIQEAGARLAAEVPFATAQELFSQLTGLSLSGHTTHEVVGEVGQGLGVLEVSPTAEEIVQRVAAVAPSKQQPPVMVLAIDGAHVPTRPESAKGPGKGRKRKRVRRARWHGEWKEAKGFRFYLVDKERIVHVLSWHQIQKDVQVGEALEQVKGAGLIPEEKDSPPWTPESSLSVSIPSSLRFLPGRARSLRALSKPSSTKRWRTRTTVEGLTSRASAICWSVRPSSALHKIRDRFTLRAGDLPRRATSSNCSRSSWVKFTRYRLAGIPHTPAH